MKITNKQSSLAVAFDSLISWFSLNYSKCLTIICLNACLAVAWVNVNDWYKRWEKDEHLLLNNKQFT